MKRVNWWAWFDLPGYHGPRWWQNLSPYGQSALILTFYWFCIIVLLAS